MTRAEARIGTIQEIPFDKDLIVSGNVNKTCWVWRMPGEFKRKGNEVFLRIRMAQQARLTKKLTW